MRNNDRQKRSPQRFLKVIFKSLYTRWDEMNLRNITPERERRLRDGWRKISRLGAVRFTLLVGFALSMLLTAYRKLFWAMTVPHRLVWSPDLIYWAGFGFPFALAYYFAIKGWVARLDTWRSTGRLA